MSLLLTFDDVLIKPKFSYINSRKEVDLDNGFARLPIISANMDTITGVTMARAMHEHGGSACLHRFWPIADNVKAMLDATIDGYVPWVSVGLGDDEFKRAEALFEHGARMFILDVAHAAQMQVVLQYKRLKDSLPDIFLVVGNFATFDTVNQFWAELNQGAVGYDVDGVKVGIGPGAACTTRLKTGVGIPQLSAIADIAGWLRGNKGNISLVIADGGCRTPGDVAKALAAGAHMVMLGGMLAGTDETPGEVIQEVGIEEKKYLGITTRTEKSEKFKKYRGSASKESYMDQGKGGSHLTDEGESFTVPYKGPVAEVLQDIEGGLRSSFSYVGARTLDEFHKFAEFISVTNSGLAEGKAHGKS